VISILDQPRSDTIHLTVAGYKTAGQRLGLAVRAGSYGLPESLGPRLTLVDLDAQRTRITLTYDKNVTGGNLTALYRVTANGTPIQVVSATTSGRTVELLLQRAAAGDVRVSYGYSRSPGSPFIRAVDGSGIALAFWNVPAP
jgi:hypothetical protein